MTHFDIKIENVVAYVEFTNRIPLNKLTKNVNPDIPGVIYKIKDPEAAVLIMPTGKIFCTGLKNIDDCVIALKKGVDKITRSGIIMSGDIEMKIYNITAVTKIGTEFNLEEISFTMDNCEYNPKKIKGLIYKLTDPKITMILFHSGKVLCTHVKTIEDIHVGLNKLKRELQHIGVAVTPMLID